MKMDSVLLLSLFLVLVILCIFNKIVKSTNQVNRLM